MADFPRMDDSLEAEEQFLKNIDDLDVIYQEDQPYIGIHFVDLLQEEMSMILKILGEHGETEIAGHPIMDVTAGVAWVLMVLKQIHDELLVRHELQKVKIPDTIEGL